MKCAKLLPRLLGLPLVILGGLLLLARVLWDRLRGRPGLPPAQTWLDTSKPLARAEGAKAAVTEQAAKDAAPHHVEVEAVAVVVETTKAQDRAARRKALRELARKVDQ